MQTSCKTKKILLVAPQNLSGSFWDFSETLNLIGKKTFTPSLGLITIAAMLPADCYDVRLVDMNVTHHLADGDLEWADLVFVSGMTIAHSSIIEVLQRAKDMGRTTVFGGSHASQVYRDFAHVDCFVLGEAENVWDEFLADLGAGNLKKAYATPCSEKEHEIMLAVFGDFACIKSPERYPEFADVVARFDLLDINAYQFMIIQTTRGCPFTCEFCDSWVRFGKMRFRAVEKVISELDALYNLGWRGGIILANDNTFGNRSYAKQLLTAIARWQIEHRVPFSFHTEGSINVADDLELLELCAASGLNTLFIGIETPHADSLKEANKHVNLAGDLEAKIATLQGYGINTAAGLIIGFDADPDNIADIIASCVQRMGVIDAMPNMLMALPFTSLTANLEKQGRIFREIHMRFNNSAVFITNFKTQRKISEVQASYASLLGMLYPDDMKAYFDRCFTFLNRKGTLRESLKKLRKRLFPHVKPLTPKLPGSKKRIPARVLLHLVQVYTIRPYGRKALRFLLDMRKHCPGQLKMAVNYVVEGQHFWHVSKTYREASEAWNFMAQKLAYMYATLRVEIPEQTELLLGNRLVCDSSKACVSVRPTQAKEVKNAVLSEVNAKLRRLSPAARDLLKNEYQCFCSDIDACMLKAENA